MQQRLKVLRGLVMESSYAPDPELVADAIVERARARLQVPGTRHRNDPSPDELDADFGSMGPRPSQVRSFRPARGVRSFTVTAPRRSRDANHHVVLSPAGADRP
jgi:hypothetical protein